MAIVFFFVMYPKKKMFDSFASFISAKWNSMSIYVTPDVKAKRTLKSDNTTRKREVEALFAIFWETSCTLFYFTVNKLRLIHFIVL